MHYLKQYCSCEEVKLSMFIISRNSIQPKNLEWNKQRFRINKRYIFANNSHCCPPLQFGEKTEPSVFFYARVLASFKASRKKGIKKKNQLSFHSRASTPSHITSYRDIHNIKTDFRTQMKFWTKKWDFPCYRISTSTHKCEVFKWLIFHVPFIVYQGVASINAQSCCNAK